MITIVSMDKLLQHSIHNVFQILNLPTSPEMIIKPVA